MNDDAVLATATGAGFTLTEIEHEGRPAWRWLHASETGWQPVTWTRQEAVELMKSRLLQIGHDPNSAP